MTVRVKEEKRNALVRELLVVPQSDAREVANLIEAINRLDSQLRATRYRLYSLYCWLFILVMLTILIHGTMIVCPCTTML